MLFADFGVGELPWTTGPFPCDLVSKNGGEPIAGEENDGGSGVLRGWMHPRGLGVAFVGCRKVKIFRERHVMLLKG